jgi:hypothetical protein
MAIKVKFTLSHFLKALSRRGIWYQVLPFRDEMVVFTHYKTIWFSQRKENTTCNSTRVSFPS